MDHYNNTDEDINSGDYQEDQGKGKVKKGLNKIYEYQKKSQASQSPWYSNGRGGSARAHKLFGF